MTFNYFTNSKPRNNTIQVFRALAIIAVVMIHTTPLGLHQVICRPFINFSVATFLFLSGYLTRIDNKDWFAFYKKRILRVLIPYIIWTFIYTLPNLSEPKVLIHNVLTANAAGHLYYILVYIQFVVLTQLLGRLAKSRYLHLGLLVTPLSLVIFKYNQFYGIDFCSQILLLWRNSFLGWFTFYYLGLLLGNRIIVIHVSLKSLLWLYVVSILLQMTEGYIWLLNGDVNCGTQAKLSSLLTSSIFVLIAFKILERYEVSIKKFNLLCVIGNYSFGIYFCHIFVMRLMINVHSYGVLPYPLNSFVVVVLSLILCIFLDKVAGASICRLFGIK